MVIFHSYVGLPVMERIDGYITLLNYPLTSTHWYFCITIEFQPPNERDIYGKPWLSREVPHMWDHTMGVFDMKGDGIFMEYWYDGDINHYI